MTLTSDHCLNVHGTECEARADVDGLSPLEALNERLVARIDELEARADVDGLVARYRTALETAHDELVQDVDPDAVIEGIEIALLAGDKAALPGACSCTMRLTMPSRLFCGHVTVTPPPAPTSTREAPRRVGRVIGGFAASDRTAPRTDV